VDMISLAWGNRCHHSYANSICARVGVVGVERSRKA